MTNGVKTNDSGNAELTYTLSIHKNYQLRKNYLNALITFQKYILATSKIQFLPPYPYYIKII